MFSLLVERERTLMVPYACLLQQSCDSSAGCLKRQLIMLTLLTNSTSVESVPGVKANTFDLICQLN